MGELTKLLELFGSDKVTTHSYGEVYEQLLLPKRKSPLPVLEIGVCNGGSLRAWRAYFHLATIHGIDVRAETMILGEPRILTHLCSQSDTQNMKSIGECFGPFQAIIDDGSHRLPDVQASFRILSPYLSPTGVYVIEDVQSEDWFREFPQGTVLDRRGVKGRYDDVMIVMNGGNSC